MKSPDSRVAGFPALPKLDECASGHTGADVTPGMLNSVLKQAGLKKESP